MELSLEHHEVIKNLMLIDHFVIMPQFNDGHLVIEFDRLIGSPADRVPFQVKFVLDFMGNLNPLAGHVLVAEPLACVIAEIYVVSKKVEPMAQTLTAFCTFFIVRTDFELVAERVARVFKNLLFVFKLFEVEIL